MVLVVGDSEITRNYERLARSYPERMKNLVMFPFPFLVQLRGLETL